MSLGRIDDARRVAEDAVAIADKVLAAAARLPPGTARAAAAGRPAWRHDHDRAQPARGAAQCQARRADFADAAGASIPATSSPSTTCRWRAAIWVTCSGRRAGCTRRCPITTNRVKDARRSPRRRRTSTSGSFYNVGACVLRHAQARRLLRRPAPSIDSGKPYLAEAPQARTAGQPRRDASSNMMNACPWRSWLCSATTSRPAQHILEGVRKRPRATSKSRERMSQAGNSGVQFNTADLPGPLGLRNARLSRCGTGRAARTDRAQVLGTTGDRRPAHPGRSSRPGWPWRIARQGKTAEAAQLIAPVGQVRARTRGPQPWRCLGAGRTRERAVRAGAHRPRAGSRRCCARPRRCSMRCPPRCATSTTCASGASSSPPSAPRPTSPARARRRACTTRG